MIAHRFIRYLKPVPPRNMPKVNQFLGFMGRRLDDAEVRGSHLTPMGYGARVLEEIIKLADLDTLLLPGDPQNRTGPNLIPWLKDLEKPIDPRTGKRSSGALFVRSKTTCFEIIVPGRAHAPLIDIPYDAPYNDPRWSKIKPLRVCDMGTCDYTTNIHTGYLVYPRRGPTHVVYSLDVFALVSKFVAYYHAHPHSGHRDQVLYDFIHKEVIVPALLEDTLALWLRNTYRQQLISVSPLEQLTSTVWDVAVPDTIGSEFTAAMGDVLQLQRDLKAQSLTAPTALSSLLVTPDKQSVSQYFTELYTTTQIPPQQQYLWVECAKNLAWFEFVIMVTSCVPDSPDAISLQRDILREVRLWLMAKPWMDIHSSVPFKTMIRSRLEGLYTYLRTTV